MLHGHMFKSQVSNNVSCKLQGVFSAVLTNCSTNHGLIPVNKNLWWVFLFAHKWNSNGIWERKEASGTSTAQTNGCVSALRSLSYVTTLACFAYVLLALIYYTVDVQKWWTGAPFLFPGETEHHVRITMKQTDRYFIKFGVFRLWCFS